MLWSGLVRGCLDGACQRVSAVLFGQAPVHTASKLARASVTRPGRCGARASDHSAQERKIHVEQYCILVLVPVFSDVPQLDACSAVLWPSFLSTRYCGVPQSELLQVRQDRSLQPPRPNRSLDRGAAVLNAKNGWQLRPTQRGGPRQASDIFPQSRGICCVWPGERSLVLSGPEGRKVVVPHGQAVVACKDTGSVYPQLVNFTFDAGRERNLSAATLLLVRDAMSAVCRLCSWSL